MTELEKEIRKYLKKTFHHEYYDDVVMVMGFAEPREKRIAELEGKNSRYKEMCEDMKADMCGTDNKVLCDYLVRILKKYGEIV